MKVVIRIGGSVVGSPLNANLINNYISLLKNLKTQGHKIITVVGGGSLAREFIKVAEDLGLKEKDRDWAAIHVSRLFAQLFVLGLGDAACKKVPHTLDEAENSFNSSKLVVMGGLHPGMTTDAVAALIGERLNLDLLVKGSNIDGIYNKDPHKFSEAKKLDNLKFEELSSIFELDSHTAGINQVIDPEAVRILQRYKLKTIIVNGYNPENILSAVDGKKVGTIIE